MVEGVEGVGGVEGEDGVERPLAGGVANQGAVVRVGDTVRRPRGPWSAVTRAVLDHLEAVGFDGSPRHLGTDDRGRDVLSWIPGDVPLPPFPPWACTDEVLAEVGRLLRRFHDAMAGFDPAAHTGWATELVDPEGGPLVCHNDVCPENVIFRDGRAVALVDFDFAAPGRPLWDVVRTVRMWAPTDDPAVRPTFPPSIDAVARVGVFARAYGVGPDDAERTVELLSDCHEVGRQFIRRRLAADEPAFVAMWERSNGAARMRRNPRWLAANRDAMVAAIARR